MDHRTTLRVVGILTIALLGSGIVYFQSFGGKPIIETLYEIFILIIGVFGTIAVQLIIWPERFLPKSAQPANSLVPTIEQKSIENIRPLSQGEFFKSELLPRQNTFHRGDPVLFTVRFKGQLTNGYVATYIKKPDGKFEGVFDHSTLVSTRTGKGNLNGDKNIEKRWSWMIPIDCKTGTCRFFIHVGNYYDIPSRWVRIKAWGLHMLYPKRTDIAKGTNQGYVGNWETVEIVE